MVSLGNLEEFANLYMESTGCKEEAYRFALDFAREAAKTLHIEVIPYKALREGVLADFLSFVSPTKFAQMSGKAEVRRIYNSLLTEFLRNTPNSQDLTISSIFRFLLDKNFHEEFVKDVVFDYMTRNGYSREDVDDPLPLDQVKDIFRSVAEKTVFLGGTKNVNKKNYEKIKRNLSVVRQHLTSYDEDTRREFTEFLRKVDSIIVGSRKFDDNFKRMWKDLLDLARQKHMLE